MILSGEDESQKEAEQGDSRFDTEICHIPRCRDCFSRSGKTFDDRTGNDGTEKHAQSVDCLINPHGGSPVFIGDRFDCVCHGDGHDQADACAHDRLHSQKCGQGGSQRVKEAGRSKKQKA